MTIQHTPGGHIGKALADVDAVMTALPQPSGHFVVNHDNILAAARIIQGQIKTLNDLLKDRANELRVEPPGEDVVSLAMADEWNRKLVYDDDSYVARVRMYVKGLGNLSDQLRDSARNYGHSEADIEAAFRSRT